jgi:hypothetical protein
LPALGATKASAWLGRYQGNWEAKDVSCCKGTAKLAFHVDDFFNYASMVGFLSYSLNDWTRFPTGALPEGEYFGGIVNLNFDWVDDITFKGDPRCPR